MNRALKLCSLALNPSSPSPTATMVKVDQGFMSSYGGLFCIRVPVTQDIGAAFNPKLLATFFRKERDKVAYTIKFPKLTVSHGKERLTINCLEPDELAIIDNIESPQNCELDMKNLKIAAELIDTTNSRQFALGVTFRDGAMISTNNAVFFMAESGLPDDMDFNIPKEACVALTKFKSTVTGISRNNQTVKFIFKDGSSLCSHIITDKFPSIDFLFDGDWQSFVLKEDIKDLDCDEIRINGGIIQFSTESSIGELEDAIEGHAEISCKKKYFNYLLDIGNEIHFIPKQRIKVEGEKSVMITSMIV